MCPDPEVELRRVVAANIDAVLALSVRDDEAHLIADNAEWLAQAAHVHASTTYGVWCAGKAVGLVSIIDPRISEDAPPSESVAGSLYVWRLMVDAQHRGRGIGSTVLASLARLAIALGLPRLRLTTMDRERGNALAFYRQLGFEPTGRRIDDEIELSACAQRLSATERPRSGGSR